MPVSCEEDQDAVIGLGSAFVGIRKEASHDCITGRLAVEQQRYIRFGKSELGNECGGNGLRIVARVDQGASVLVLVNAYDQRFASGVLRKICHIASHLA